MRPSTQTKKTPVDNERLKILVNDGATDFGGKLEIDRVNAIGTRSLICVEMIQHRTNFFNRERRKVAEVEPTVVEKACVFEETEQETDDTFELVVPTTELNCLFKASTDGSCSEAILTLPVMSLMDFQKALEMTYTNKASL